MYKDKLKRKEAIHDQNIYYVICCKNNCGIEWLTEDEIVFGEGFCDGCRK